MKVKKKLSVYVFEASGHFNPMIPIIQLFMEHNFEVHLTGSALLKKQCDEQHWVFHSMTDEENNVVDFHSYHPNHPDMPLCTLPATCALLPKLSCWPMHESYRPTSSFTICFWRLRKSSAAFCARHPSAAVPRFCCRRAWRIAFLRSTV